MTEYMCSRHSLCSLPVFDSKTSIFSMTEEDYVHRVYLMSLLSLCVISGEILFLREEGSVKKRRTFSNSLTVSQRTDDKVLLILDKTGKCHTFCFASFEAAFSVRKSTFSSVNHSLCRRLDNTENMRRAVKRTWKGQTLNREVKPRAQGFGVSLPSFM